MDAFQNKWLGKRVDYDGVYQYQCVDLIKQYLYECFDLHPQAWGDAKDYWLTTHPLILEKFNKVVYKDGTRASKGDILILKPTPYNQYGHIGIATGAALFLEQNGATGDGDGAGGDEIRLREIPYSRLYGYLRPKGEIAMPLLGETRIRRIFREVRGRLPTDRELASLVGKKIEVSAEFNTFFDDQYGHDGAVEFRKQRAAAFAGTAALQSKLSAAKQQAVETVEALS